LASSPPLLTVAIPTCNGAPHLAETLDSVLAQEGAAFELIVVDDRSEDGTLELARHRAGSRARIISNDKRLGLAGNWNQCVAHCQTPLIAIVHQDDVLAPGHLARHLEAFLRDEPVGLVASASTVIDEVGRDVPPLIVDRGGLGPEDLTFEPGALFEAFALGNPLRCSAVSIRVEAYRDVRGFDPLYRYVLDWDFWIRVARRWRVAWLATPTVQVRWHTASETHRFKTGRADLDETKRLLDNLLEQAPPGRHELKRLRKQGRARLARAFLSRAHDALHAGRIELARDSLKEALGLSAQAWLAILADPRLAAQLGALWLPASVVRRHFTRSR
jgi:glycosyltransferase involved in cell wall biosynthesis